MQNLRIEGPLPICTFVLVSSFVRDAWVETDAVVALV
jgi:hypothetical protein